jgi:hypothetical protein
MCAGWNSKHVVELLEGALFGFRDKEEDHYECGDVKTTVLETFSINTRSR